MARPIKAGVKGESRQATRFRREFRKYRDRYGATNREIGEALEDYGLCGMSDGTTSVQNALTLSRKLTHEWARRLVAGLLLTEAARSQDEMADPAPQALFNLLVAIGAKRIEPPAMPAVFMPPSGIAGLIDYIEREAQKVLGPKSRAALAKAMKRSLQSDAAQMAHAWVTAVRETFPKDAMRDRVFVYNLPGRVFGLDYYDNTPRVEREPEFEVLFAIRPELIYHDLAAHFLTGEEKT